MALHCLQMLNWPLKIHQFEQVLCYEVKVQTKTGQVYTLFVDAVTHKLIKKEHIKG